MIGPGIFGILISSFFYDNCSFDEFRFTWNNQWNEIEGMWWDVHGTSQNSSSNNQQQRVVSYTANYTVNLIADKIAIRLCWFENRSWLVFYDNFHSLFFYYWGVLDMAHSDFLHHELVTQRHCCQGMHNQDRFAFQPRATVKIPATSQMETQFQQIRTLSKALHS